MTAPIAASIPAKLKAIPHWVLWRGEEVSPGKFTKVPYQVGKNLKASSTDSSTWSNFDAALAGLNGYDGVGWVVTVDTGIVLIDLDNTGIDPFIPWASGILHRIPSYAERSPSGTGVHIIVKGSLPPGARKRGNVEMYDQGRFFTITGDTVGDAPTIEPVDIHWLHRLMEAGVYNFQVHEGLERLMRGQWRGSYPSQSEADLALCSLLNCLRLDAKDIDLAFRLSGLMRPKWDALRGNSTYGQNTVATVTKTKGNQKASTVTPSYSVSDSPAPESPEAPAYSEIWLARRFVATHGSKLRYTAKTGKWFAFDGRAWPEDETHLVRDLAQEVCCKAALELKPNKGRALASAKTVSAVVQLASTNSTIATFVDEWDRDPWLLNCTNGVIDLRSGRLLSHNPAYLMTKITGCELAPAGTSAPIWSSFLNRITADDAELRGYLQRVTGYGLTGSTNEQCMFFAYGTGANGKGVFVNTVTGVLGSYARTAPMETFLASYVSQHPCDTASLYGARFVSSTETEKGRRWDESKIKTLTGGDKIATRFMRQDFFEFVPQFKIFVAGNHRPALRSVDEAIRRRLHLIPFTITIPPAERDLHLAEKLRAEWPAILRWAVDGCLEWQARGLNPPKAATEATGEYLAEENTVERWIEASCVLSPNYFTSTAALFEDWREWTTKMGEYTGNVKTFGQSLEAVEGVCRHRREDVRGFRGLTLR